MLNQQSNSKRIGPASQWCVGDPPQQWDVSFGALIADKVRQIFWRDTGDRPVKLKTIKSQPVLARKAA